LEELTDNVMTFPHYPTSELRIKPRTPEYKEKVKQSLYSPGQVLRIPGGWGLTNFKTIIT
jgi:hypothetical protein